MRRCLQLAQEARERGEAPVGTVIVRDGALLAEASEQVQETRDVAGHAELIAIRQACQALGTMDLAGCTLYTNLEPCWMCSFAIRETGISQVVISAPVPDIGGATSLYPILSDAGIHGWRPPPTLFWNLFSEECEYDLEEGPEYGGSEIS
jgi:tRNA(adenine34) deaminase